MRDRLERRWLIGCTLSGLLIHLILFVAGLLHQLTLGKPPDSGQFSEIFVLLVVYSFPITLFLVGIPSRIAMTSPTIEVFRFSWLQKTWIMDRLAKYAIMLGIVIMVGATISCIDEGSGLVSWEHRARAKVAVWVGAAIAVVIPAVAVFWNCMSKRKPWAAEITNHSMPNRVCSRLP
jgi:hypothetical protein